MIPRLWQCLDAPWLSLPNSIWGMTALVLVALVLLLAGTEPDFASAGKAQA